MTDFSAHTFKGLDQRNLVLLPDLAKICAGYDSARVLDLGCGSGDLLLALGAQCPQASLYGVDISEANIVLARNKAREAGAAQARLARADYLAYREGPFELIIADSTLHLIDHPFAALWGKIASDLPEGGRLVATVPVRCAYNTALIALRKLFRLLDGPLLRRVLTGLAAKAYPNLSADILSDRIMYMFIIPHFLAGPAEIAALEKDYGLRLEWSRLEALLPGKPRHGVHCFVKI
jgi:SAM-dependent methyltransferase